MRVGDDRWLFDPVVIPEIELAAKAKQTVEVKARFEPDRRPESLPVCTLRAPLQTAKGEWIDYQDEVHGRSK